MRTEVGLFAVFLCLGACASAGGPKGGQAAVCEDFAVEVEHYWSASVRAQVLDQRGELEIERTKGTVNKMDRISEDWVMMRTSVCKDHFVRELISSEDYAERVRCFDDRLAQQRSLATALSGGGELSEIEASLDQLLADPAACQAAP